jgi:hypothetical protein
LVAIKKTEKIIQGHISSVPAISPKGTEEIALVFVLEDKQCFLENQRILISGHE